MSSADSRKFRFLLLSLRPHQWTKNLLVFIPLIMAHRLANAVLMKQAGLAFAAFSLCASASYVWNDWIDRHRDSLHPKKKNRPMASGRTSPFAAAILIVMLLSAGLSIAWFLPRDFYWILIAYLVSSLAYSLFLKRIAIVDVMVLAFLYTVRIFGGAIASQVPVSSWLLTYSIFIFFSLAMLKRYSELRFLTHDEGLETGRGYDRDDLEHLARLGTSSGYLSVLVLALYVNSADVAALYRHPHYLWWLCPVMLYWVSHIWLLAHRGKIVDDPIYFALKDKASYAAGLVAIAVVGMAS